MKVLSTIGRISGTLLPVLLVVSVSIDLYDRYKQHNQNKQTTQPPEPEEEPIPENE